MDVIIAAAVEPDGSVGHSWGKARSVVVATIEADEVADWRPYEVCWDLLHDEGTPGAHHARVVTFLRTHGVEIVLVDHVGDGMRRMLTSMGVDLREGISGDAREAMRAAVRSSSEPVG
jgi:predicted Fe-Mo cluster-binding NifX family protein